MPNIKYILHKMVRLICFVCSAFFLGACASSRTELRQINNFIAEQQFLKAGEFLREVLKANPGNKEAAQLLENTDKRMASDIQNPDFTPRRYFYAQAYQNFFHDHLYRQALEDLEQVMIFELENEEILEFLDKIYLSAKQDEQKTMKQVSALIKPIPGLVKSGKYAESLEQCSKALMLDPKNTRVLKLSARIGKLMGAAAKLKKSKTDLTAAPAAASPVVIAQLYREALMLYMGGNQKQASAQLKKLLDMDPSNERAQKALQRIQNELPDAQ